MDNALHCRLQTLLEVCLFLAGDGTAIAAAGLGRKLLRGVLARKLRIWTPKLTDGIASTGSDSSTGEQG
jgi:hypothetical protein